MHSFKQLVVASFLFVGLSSIGQNGYSMETKSRQTLRFDTAAHQVESLEFLLEAVKEEDAVELALHTLRSMPKLQKSRNIDVQIAFLDLVYELLDKGEGYDFAQAAVQPLINSQESWVQIDALDFVFRLILMHGEEEEVCTLAQYLVTNVKNGGNLKYSSDVDTFAPFLKRSVLQVLSVLVDQPHASLKKSCELAQEVVLMLKDNKNIEVLLYALEVAYRLNQQKEKPAIALDIIQMLNLLKNLIENGEIGEFPPNVAQGLVNNIEAKLKKGKVDAVELLSEKDLSALLATLI